MIRYEPGHIPGTDCNAIKVQMQPVGDAPLPTCGGADEIPFIRFSGEGVHGTLDLLLGNVTDPVAYTHDLGRQLIAFSAQIARERDERMPEAAR